MVNAGFAPLVVDGDTVKMRILAERQFHRRSVHVDWVRFTCLLRDAPVPNADVLFTRWDNPDLEIQDANRVRSLMDFHGSEFQATAQANELAHRVAAALGSDFHVFEDAKKGMDFYKYRWSITLNGNEVAWVGFLSSSDSPRQSKQAGTIHANIMGTACTFASEGWTDRLAELVDDCEATLTRADLALDFFDGYPGGIEAVRTSYREGRCNVGGRKLKFNLVGDWENGHDRSVYIGSREAGKITNIYEKGDQLYGEKANSDWVRFELRYGNKFRVLSSEILRRPDDFFAGASDWHQSVMLQQYNITTIQTNVEAEKVPCLPRLQIESCTAECSRNLRWLKNTAASSLKAAIDFLDHDDLVQLIGNAVLPGRLRKFSKEQIANCFSPAVKVVTELPNLVRVPGTVATYSFFSANPSPVGY
jgi:phage replication initiation protein